MVQPVHQQMQNSSCNLSVTFVPRTEQVHYRDEETWGQLHPCECRWTSRECRWPLLSIQCANQVDPTQQQL